MPRWLLLGICLTCLPGCLGGGWRTTLGYARPDSFVTTEDPTYTVAARPDSGMAVTVAKLARGVRGVACWLEVENQRTGQELVLDVSRIEARLGIGHGRHCLSGEELSRLAPRSAWRAYGLEEADEPPPRPAPLVLPPGESRRVLVVLGVPEEETLLFLRLPVAGDVYGRDARIELVLALPDVDAAARNPDWWPEWLHLNLSLSSDAISGR